MTDEAITRKEVEEVVELAVSKAMAKERETAKEAARAAVTETFKILGVDLDNFQDAKKLSDDLDWVRKYRKLSESVGSKVLITITTIVTGGFLVAFWAFLQEYIKR